MGLPGKKLPLDTRRIYFRGLVDLNGLFKIMRQWLIDYEYEFEERTAKYKLEGTGGTKELDWYAEKNVTDYLRFVIQCKFVIKNIQEVEVIKKGQKKQLSQCHLILEINPMVVLDPYGYFDESAFLEKLRIWLWNTVLKKDILFRYADQLDYRTLKFQNVVKEYLDFESREYSYATKA